jgi:hypothetical protein
MLGIVVRFHPLQRKDSMQTETISNTELAMWFLQTELGSKKHVDDCDLEKMRKWAVRELLRQVDERQRGSSIPKS